jgi:hypothetical protein
MKTMKMLNFTKKTIHKIINKIKMISNNKLIDLRKKKIKDSKTIKSNKLEHFDL